MKSFRNPKYNERYEDVVFDLETALRVSKRMDPDLLLITVERSLHSIGIILECQSILK